jgi:hypothetical protein
MPGVSHRSKSEPDEKRIVFLEFLAAFALLCIVGLVLYMVFSYRPA